jgi:hypothetical protein
MTRTLLLAAALVSLAPAVPAATLVRDLGLGLTYYRVHSLPEDVPTAALTHAGPSVLDLRFTSADDAGAAVLRAWVKFNASAKAPVFILENAGTSPALLAAMARGAGGTIILAPEDSGLRSDVQVRVPADTDRKAYDALEKGANVDALLADYPDKPRADEEYLEKEHLADSDNPDPEADKPRPLVDRMLQRAYQLHRGLLALKRI